MNRAKVIGILTVLALTLGACGEDEEQPSGRPPPNPQSPWKVAFDYYTGETRTAPGFRDLWFSDPAHGWACTETRVFRFKDGTWKFFADMDKIFPRIDFRLESICAPTPDEVWLGAEFKTRSENLVFHYNGNSWETVYPGYSIWSVGDIYFVSAREGWFGCWSYGPFHLLRYDNGNWSSQLEGVSFTTLSFSGPDDGWACGFDEASDWYVYHFNGSTWNEVDIPGPAATEYLKIDANAPNDVWLLKNHASTGGNTSTVLHYDGAGWTKVGGFSEWQFGCDFVSPTDGWVAGLNDEFQRTSWHYDGSRFTAYPWPWNDLRAQSLWANNATDVWVGTPELEGHSYMLHFTGFK